MTTRSLQSELEQFIAGHQLPTQYLQQVDQWFMPVADQVEKHQQALERPLVLGINGCQGSGKSTLADLLVLLFSVKGLSAVALSVDDFYLTLRERQALAESKHPLLLTRGVPGTHDVGLAIATLQQLRKGNAPVNIPRFDKSIDDRSESSEQQTKPVDVIILEGWCLGAAAADSIAPACNDLESLEDPEGVWRNYVNQQLKTHYKEWHSLVDLWIMLKAPAFSSVFRWRKEQEDKLRAKLMAAGVTQTSGLMDDQQLQRFIQHYQRVTENILDTLPDQVHFLYSLDENRKITSLTTPNSIPNTMTKQIKPLIFTDMDGSLLDHHTYSHSAADPLLEKLESNQIPVIPCTSKTAAELIVIRAELNNKHPFIGENGAAAYIPVGYFNDQPEATEVTGDYWVKSFVQPRVYWVNKLAEVASDFEGEFRNYSQMTADEIAELTGLSLEDARLSATRDYSEPVSWQGTEERKSEFITALQNSGVHILQGGRFIHLSGNCDKGQALKWLAKQFDGSTLTIAIGDSQNDIAMLEVADEALLIPSPVHALPSLNRTAGFRSGEGYGPIGWAEGVTAILEEHQLL